MIVKILSQPLFVGQVGGSRTLLEYAQPLFDLGLDYHVQDLHLGGYIPAGRRLGRIC